MNNLRTKLSYAFYTLLALVFLSSCNQTSDNINDNSHQKYESGSYKSFHVMMNQCKGLTKVVGVSEMDGSFSHCKISVVVVDSTNTYYECRIGGKLGLKVGDTVKVVQN